MLAEILISNKSKRKSFRKVNNVLFNYAKKVSDDLWKLKIAFSYEINDAPILKSLICDLKKTLNKDVNVFFYHDGNLFYQINMPYVPYKYKNDWKYIPYIKALVATAGLLHDIGKTNYFFQKKLRNETDSLGDPIRHEFLSCKMIEAIYSLYQDKWIDKIISNDISVKDVSQFLLNDSNKNKINVKDMPFYMKVILYLILSHHKLPFKENENFSIDSLDSFFEKINFSFGYKNEIESNDIYSFHPLIANEEFIHQFKKYGYFLINDEAVVKSIVEDVELFHFFVSFSRLSLMMADHYVSSNIESCTKKAADIIWANKNKNGTFNQPLLFHLVAVSKKAVEIAQKSEGLLRELPSVSNNLLDKNSPDEFKWQDYAAEKISEYIDIHKNEKNLFFCCNMASTGKGKTIANAKIENAMLSGKMRYTLGVGLRTLVLQTGDNYIHDIHFEKKDVSICVGSKADEELYKKDFDFEEDLMHNQNIFEINSDNELVDNEVKFLEVLFKNQLKYKAFLYKPILVCTIDYMMRLTQCVKGGKYMLPFMRLLSSDLVLDEIDDYNFRDLKAILPLAYFVGMCGRNFTISSATITPDLAEAMNTAYQKGLTAYEKFFNVKVNKVNVICDEYDCVLSDSENYKKLHSDFSFNRKENLEKEIINRRGKIILMSLSPDNFVKTIHNSVLEFHDNNHVIDEKTKKFVSIGCVRIANVNPCVMVAKAMTLYDDQDYEIRVMCYHSRQILLLRREQEVYLSKVLNRKQETEDVVSFNDSVMRSIIDNSKCKNIIFLLVATPVEEIGRDHDFDWCIIEPSSVHSIIQMAGRVLRHRHLKSDLTQKNIGILQYNYAHLTSKYRKIFGNKCFVLPGVESNSFISLASHDMNDVISDINIEEKINSVPFITKPDLSFYIFQKNFYIFDTMNKAEHYEFQTLNDFQVRGAEMVYDYIHSYIYLTGLPQTINNFRDDSNSADEDVIAWIGDNQKNIILCQYNSEKKLTQVSFPLTFDDTGYDKNKLWILRDYKKSLRKLNNGKTESQNSQFYGEATVIPSDSKHDLFYNDNFGFFR